MKLQNYCILIVLVVEIPFYLASPSVPTEEAVATYYDGLNSYAWKGLSGENDAVLGQACKNIYEVIHGSSVGVRHIGVLDNGKLEVNSKIFYEVDVLQCHDIRKSFVRAKSKHCVWEVVVLSSEEKTLKYNNAAVCGGRDLY